jgi:hypothetical protein
MIAEDFPTSEALAEALQHPEKSDDYIMGQVDFLNGVNQLMSELRVTREPDRLQLDFEYLIGPFVSLELPASMTDYCDTDLEDATITLSKDAGTEPLASLELNFNRLSDGKLLTLFASRDPEAVRDSEAQDAVLIKDAEEPIPIPRIPKHDINAFVLSLALGQNVYDREGLETATIFSGDAYDTLVDSLRQTAESWRTHYSYGFNNDKRSLTWTIQSTALGEWLESCRFTYETAASDRSIAVDIDPSSGLALRFWQLNPVEFWQPNAVDGTTPFSPDTGDLMRLQEIIEELVQQYDNTEVVLTAPHLFKDAGIDDTPKLIVMEPNEDDNEPR